MTIIRPARPEDLAGLLDLYQVFRSHDPAFDTAAATPAWTALLNSPVVTIVVAEQAGRLAASCTLAVIPNLTWQGRPYAVIENVATRSDHRRKGLGHAVLAFAVDRARTARCYKVTLSTGSMQEGTLRFYEGAGFKRHAKTFFELNLEPSRSTPSGSGRGEGLGPGANPSKPVDPT